MRATFHHSDTENHNVKTFWFEPDEPLRYTAGQYTEITLPHDNPDNRGVKRWSTLSSSPTEKLLAISSEYAGDESTSSFKRALFGLEPGAQVDLAQAMGDFVLPKDTSTRLIFVGLGIGVTPFRSIFKWLADNDEQRDITFIHSVATEDDIIFQDVFDEAHQHATIVVEQPSDTWGGERGQLTAQMILGIGKPDSDTLIYLSGAQDYLERLQRDMLHEGIKQHQIVTDFFPGYSKS